ncbi:TIGR01440 family protein [Paenibacillaceae bacterium]|nr:TIGR01440 family protein [Paenibacillaceae bacterium]
MSALNFRQLTGQVETVVREVAAAANLASGQLLVIGASTSEVAGRHIGTAGTLDVARSIFEGVENVRQDIGFLPLFQCCEHLNRALVTTRDAANRYGLDEVSAVPVPSAGGSLAAHAYLSLSDACLVEHARAHAGVDIGDTFIGMHLRHVAVPVRPSIRSIGGAHVTMAWSRPKLIGGARAVYTQPGVSASALETSSSELRQEAASFTDKQLNTCD